LISLKEANWMMWADIGGALAQGLQNLILENKTGGSQGES